MTSDKTDRYKTLRSCRITPDFPFESSAIRFHGMRYICADKGFQYTQAPGADTVIILYTRKGYGSLYYNGSSQSLSPETVVVFNTLSGYSYEAVESGWYFHAIKISGTLVNDLIKYVNSYKGLVFRAPLSIDSSIRNIYQQINNDCTFKEREIFISSELYVLFGQFLKGRIMSHKTDIAIKYIEENFEQSISVDTLAELCCMSKFYFIHAFKEENGTTPNSYLTKCRIAAAKDLLLTSKKSMVEIAAETGFDNSSYFCKRFKLYTGQTPLQFRNQKHYLL